MLKLIASILLVASSSVFANTVGNGGDVVACENGDVTTLDLFEGKMLRGFVTDMADADPMVNIAHVLDRLEQLDPRRADRYRQHVSTFMNETQFIEDAELIDISDSDERIIPNKCKVKQAAIQSEPKLPHDKRYLIDKAIWNSLDGVNKASLILHEIIYREALEKSHANSVLTRYLNSYISTPESATSGDYYKIVDEMEFYPSFLVIGESGKRYLISVGGLDFKGEEVEQLRIQREGELGDLYPAMNKVAAVYNLSAEVKFRDTYAVATFVHNYVYFVSRHETSDLPKTFFQVYYLP